MNTENTSKLKTNYYTNKILLGTHTSNQDYEYVYIGEVKTPLQSTKKDVLQFENYTGYISSKKKRKGQALPHFEVKAKLLHPGEIIRASHLPNNPFFIITQTCNGNILLFDYTKHPSFPSDMSTCYPQMILKGHTSEGNGLCWNINKMYNNCSKNSNNNNNTTKNVVCNTMNSTPDNKKLEKKNSNNSTIEQDNENNTENFQNVNPDKLLLASCDTSGNICLWDINKGTKCNDVPRTYGINKTGKTADYSIKIYENTPTLGPLCTWSNKNNLNVSLNDIFFHPQFNNVLSVCDDNGNISFYDIRNKNFYTKPELNFKYHPEQVNTFSFDNFSEHIFTCGYSDGLIALWDIRYNQEPLLLMDYHTKSINRVKFCMVQSGIFGSCSDDGLACIWDISRNSSNYENFKKQEDDIYNSYKKVPKQLLFVHGGHIGSVYDMSWANSNTFLVATVGIDNSLQVWHMNEQFLFK
ncbi:chromatin assembly factor 1 subunit, putative [Hepatocystis sp. ex Piliocolobus tephrosceles]|nr:chromatin assembly factor 1 subunit, putative [Hepatocystis sp. ex Piliocolobus tephrosceles]